MLNLTPQEILDQVNNTEPNDFYLDQIQKCVENGNIIDSWGVPRQNSNIGGFLFRNTGIGDLDLLSSEEKNYCLCLTQIKK